MPGCDIESGLQCHANIRATFGRIARSCMLHQDLPHYALDTEPVRLELQKRRAAELLRQAQESFEQERLEPARAVLEEALGLDPSNRSGRALWEAIQRQIQQLAILPRIEASLSAGEEHLAKRQFADAVGAFETALDLDRDNAGIRERLEKTRALVEQAGKAFQLLAEARRHFEHQNLTAAYRMVSEALTHDPKNPDAAEFLKTIEEFIHRRHAEQREDEALRKAEGLMLLPDYDEATAVLLATDSSSPRIQECLDYIRSQRAAYDRERRLRKEISAATDLLRGQRMDEAAKCLDALKVEFPESQEVANLIAYTQKERAVLARAKAIESAAAEARSPAASNDFEGALAALGEALKIYPDDTAMVRLLATTMAAKSEWERRRAIESALVRCASLRSEHKLASALQVVERALKDYQSEPSLLTALKELEAELAEHRRLEAVRRVVSQAEYLLARMQLDAAVDEGACNYCEFIPRDILINHDLMPRRKLAPGRSGTGFRPTPCAVRAVSINLVKRGGDQFS